MKTYTRVIGLLLALLAALALAATAHAQEGGGYDLTWWTVDGGGEAVSHAGSGYVVLGTAGQPEPGPLLVGDSYSLAGGFWPGAGGAERKIYLPLILRSYT